MTQAAKVRAMSVLIIRASKRFAIRRKVSLRTAETRAVDGLMVELSAEGCRITNLGSTPFAIGEAVTIATEDDELRGRVRWVREGVAGIRLDAALHLGDLAQLVSRSRDGEALRFGT
ncbi:MAG: hypothetical protein B7Z08_09235 [Sphingomonadales bacterium 32-68-7]|nr:MAG: hypothetical protein B7Z33_11875 [Sphingomonadales bacterium 12-68-11]OYX08480.1 MAG: hypothetical protein B7Z08_09235 [Sphingomonadales bacterium 32-68-7]